MRMPAFTAESSLAKNTRSYRAQRSTGNGSGRSVQAYPVQSAEASLLVPASFTPYWCRLNEETWTFECEEERPI